MLLPPRRPTLVAGIILPIPLLITAIYCAPRERGTALVELPVEKIQQPAARLSGAPAEARQQQRLALLLEHDGVGGGGTGKFRI